MTGTIGTTTSTIGATSPSGGASDAAGWFFPDRVDLPFVAERYPLQFGAPEPDAPGAMPASSDLVDQRTDPTGRFAERNWAGDWACWLTFLDLTRTNWLNLITIRPPPGLDQTNEEIDILARYARDERADAMGEILSQDTSFIGDFMGLLGATPASHPATYHLLNIAKLTGLAAAMHFKNVHNRRRPSQVCPALRPPIPLPGHPAYPSAHATKAHLIAFCLKACFERADARSLSAATTSTGSTRAAAGVARYVITNGAGGIVPAVTVLAHRIARNREIAGLHYPSDSEAGRTLAQDVFAILVSGSRFESVLLAASKEWA